MMTKIALRLTRGSVAESQEDINHMIEALYTGLRAGGVKAVAMIFDRWQGSLFKKVLGKKYYLKNKRKDTPWECHRCKNRRYFCRKGKRTIKRKLKSSLGTIHFPLYQVKCLQCGKVFAPALEVWHISPYQRYSEEMLYRIVRLAIEMPYARASRVMKLTNAIDIDASTVKRWIDRLGKRCLLQTKPITTKVILADSTRVKAGKLQRGEIVQVALGINERGKELLGLSLGKDWKPLLSKIREGNPELLVSDGDDYIASAVSRLNWPIAVQRCRWHMAHQGKHYLFRDGVPAREHAPWIKRINRIIFSDTNKAQKQWQRLINDLYRKGFKMIAGYFKYAASELWTYRFFKTYVPTTTSLVEREMREINRRTDVGVRWSVEGVKNILNLNLGYRHQHYAWKNLWPLKNKTNNINFEVELLNVKT